MLRVQTILYNERLWMPVKPHYKHYGSVEVESVQEQVVEPVALPIVTIEEPVAEQEEEEKVEEIKVENAREIMKEIIKEITQEIAQEKAEEKNGEPVAIETQSAEPAVERQSKEDIVFETRSIKKKTSMMTIEEVKSTKESSPMLINVSMISSSSSIAPVTPPASYMGHTLRSVPTKNSLFRRETIKLNDKRKNLTRKIKNVNIFSKLLAH